jgi:predicted TIM-barrel fold metal-dependent hydrolase
MRHPILRAWHDAVVSRFPPDIEVWDAHTHTGDADPDGFTNSAHSLLAAIDDAGQSGAVVVTAADPAGYAIANDRILAEAEGAGGRLIPFLRVDPTSDGAVAEVRRGLEAGHRGIKLHPRSERFALSHPTVAAVVAEAAARRVPVLIHAGRGMDPLGDTPVRLIDAHPGAPLVLAHCGISDLGRICVDAATRRALLFDTAWWNPADHAALFSWVDASQILYASDMPYGAPLMSATVAGRAALQAGLSGEALTAVFGGNLRALLAADARPQLGFGVAAHPDPVLLRVASNLYGAIELSFAGVERSQPLELTLTAAQGPDSLHRGLLAAIRATVEAALAEPGLRDRLGLLIAAVSAALTPAAGHPDL